MPGLISIQNAELAFVTQEYINELPTTITLTPSRGTPVLKASGGHDYTPATPRAPQVFRVVPRPSPAGTEETQDGPNFVKKYGYTLVGMPNSIVAFGDVWDETTEDGTNLHYHVDEVMPATGWDFRANVTCYATEPQHG
jgi:hypothetical protein